MVDHKLQLAITTLNEVYNESISQGLSQSEYVQRVNLLIQIKANETIAEFQGQISKLEEITGIKADVILQATISNQFPPPLDAIAGDLKLALDKALATVQTFQTEMDRLLASYPKVSSSSSSESEPSAVSQHTTGNPEYDDA